MVPGVPMGEEGGIPMEAGTETVLMRYYLNGEVEPTTLKQVLQKTKGVKSVDVDVTERQVKVLWSGKCRDLAQMESAAAGAGTAALLLSHAHLYAAFKPQKGANLEALEKELNAVSGVKGVLLSGTAAELHVDLQTVRIDALRGAAERAHFEAQLKSHQWVEAKVRSGDAKAVADALRRLRGVLVLEENDERLGFWALALLTKEAVDRVAEKVGAELDAIERP
ncbi:MAG: hypothetical protein HYY16_16835 [Planctomycetes bacterium]|nr:hypothetical protein [Planctomycetota bacterium]